MSKILKYILFRTVLVIITLHAIIPHPHSDELTNEKHAEIHQKSNSLFGIIRLAFHESNDENLDNLVYVQFESVNKLNFKNKYPKVSISNSPQFKQEIRKTVKSIRFKLNDFNKTPFVKLNGLRGPPSLS
jgi:hypothetical protein